ncbi:MAG: nucleotidyltransferase domain-containing protein [Myxococcales bacterium]|nr:nucleotidyltransferase domain-containing protein [Myxococcales bacterium]
MDFLEGQARIVAERVLGEEESHRKHVVIALSGAHAYGFPSPDSDLDLKAIHIEPTRNLLGLGTTTEAFDRLEVIDGVEIDYTSNELRGVLAGIAAGNGNYIERVLGALICRSSPLHLELKELVPTALSQRVHRHYRGFAANQRKAFEEAEHPTAKKLLYVLRTALTGTHLLRTGELRVDLATTADEYGYGDANDLIVAKTQGERTVLPKSDRQSWLSRLNGLFELLDQAREGSPLPEEPNTSDLEAWLIETRTKALEGS